MEPSLQSHDVLGWAAAALTLLAFSCNDLLRLRYTALAANAAFIAYGLTAGLWPVLALHFVLVPINLWRLLQTKHPSPFTSPAPASPPARSAAASRSRPSGSPA